MLKFQDFCCLSWAENESRLILETSAFYRSDVDRIIDGLRVGKKREFFDQPKPFLAYEFKSLQFKFPYLRWLLNTMWYCCLGRTDYSSFVEFIYPWNNGDFFQKTKLMYRCGERNSHFSLFKSETEMLLSCLLRENVTFFSYLRIH